jgi:hypothetical protein
VLSWGSSTEKVLRWMFTSSRDLQGWGWGWGGKGQEEGGQYEARQGWVGVSCRQQSLSIGIWDPVHQAWQW